MIRIVRFALHGKPHRHSRWACYISLMRYALCFLLLFLTAPVWAAQDMSILNPSGLPIPRYVSLKSNDVNVRVGPGRRYPIRWSYHRAHLPVEIIEEFAHWRRIRDYEGAIGWVHKSVLDGKRSIMILDKPQTLYAAPSSDAQAIMRAEPMVIAPLKECTPDWCRVEIQNVAAWIRKADVWGVTREEVFDK